MAAIVAPIIVCGICVAFCLYAYFCVYRKKTKKRLNLEMAARVASATSKMAHSALHAADHAAHSAVHAVDHAAHSAVHAVDHAAHAAVHAVDHAAHSASVASASSKNLDRAQGTSSAQSSTNDIAVVVTDIAVEDTEDTKPAGAVAVGARVSHAKRGLGTVVDRLGDGRTRVVFDSGDEHRYRQGSMHKLSASGAEGLVVATKSATRLAGGRRGSASMLVELSKDILGHDHHAEAKAEEREERKKGAEAGGEEFVEEEESVVVSQDANMNRRIKEKVKAELEEHERSEAAAGSDDVSMGDSFWQEPAGTTGSTADLV